MMRIARLACLFALIGFSATAEAQSDTAASTFMAGSLRVIHQKRTVSNTVAATLFLLGGARQIDARTAGIEPLVMHAAAFGSARYPGRQSQSALARTGGSIGVDAGDDWTTWTLQVSRTGLDSAWSVFADRVMHPSLPDEAIDAATRRMLAGLVIANTNPDYALNQIARPIAFAGHPYANDPRGSDRALRIMRSSVVRDYHANQFVASRMLLVVVGNVDRAEVEKLAAATIGTMSAGSYAWALPPPVPPRKTSMTIIPRKLATDYIIGIFPGPAANTRDYGAFRLGTGLLGAYLNYAIREQEQLSYAAYAPFYDNAVTAGAIYASTQQPEKVMALMFKQAEDAGSNELPLAIMPRFANQFEIEGLMARETNAGQADALGRAYLLFGDLTAIDAGFKALRAASAGNVRGAVARYVPSIQWVFMGDTSRFRRYMR